VLVECRSSFFESLESLISAVIAQCATSAAGGARRGRRAPVAARERRGRTLSGAVSQ
jgi:hypothetical protein